MFTGIVPRLLRHPQPSPPPRRPRDLVEDGLGPSRVIAALLVLCLGARSHLELRCRSCFMWSADTVQSHVPNNQPLTELTQNSFHRFSWPTARGKWDILGKMYFGDCLKKGISHFSRQNSAYSWSSISCRSLDCETMFECFGCLCTPRCLTISTSPGN